MNEYNFRRLYDFIDLIDILALGRKQIFEISFAYYLTEIKKKKKSGF